MNSGNDNMQQGDQGPNLPPVIWPPPFGIYFAMIPVPIWPNHIARFLHEYQIRTGQAAAAFGAAETEARADAEMPLLPPFGLNYTNVVEHGMAVPDEPSSGERMITHRSITMSFGEQQAPSASEQPPQRAAFAALALRDASPEHPRPEMPLRDWREVNSQQNVPYIHRSTIYRRPLTTPIEDLGNQRAIYRPSVGLPPAEPSSAASSGSPKFELVTPPVHSVVSPMPLPPSLNRSFESCAMCYSEPSTSRYSDPSTWRYSEPSTSRYSDPSTSRYSDPSTSRYSDPSTSRYSEPSTSRYSEPSTSRYSEPSTSRYSEPSTSRYSEPSTSRSTQSQKQQSSSRLTPVRHSVKPYPQNLPRPPPVSTPLNYRMPPPAHSPAPLRAQSAMPLLAHSSLPPPAHSSAPLQTQSPMSVLAHSSLPPPAHSQMSLRRRSLKIHRKHSTKHYRRQQPIRHWEQPPALLPEHLPIPPPELSSVALPSQSPVSPPSISLSNIPMPPPRHRTPTPVHPRGPAARPPMALTAMRSAAPRPMNPTAPALHHSSYITYPMVPSPVNRATPAPARPQSAHVDLESPQ